MARLSFVPPKSMEFRGRHSLIELAAELFMARTLDRSRFYRQLEEKELSNFLVDVAKAGYRKTRKQIMGLAEAVAQDKGRMTEQK